MSGSRKVLPLIFVVALALRLLFVATRGNELSYYDSQAYSQIAQHLVAGEGWHDDVGRRASRAPGYPLFLAGFYALGIHSPRAIYLTQAVADALMCVLLALLGRRLFSARVGAIAGLIAAIYPFFIYFTGLLLAETLFILVLVAFILTLARMMAEEDSPSAPVRDTVMAGVLAGLLIHLRSSFLLFPFFLLPFWMLVARRRARTLGVWTGMVAVMALVLLPWVGRNYALFHRLIPTTLQVGESLYEANHPGADGGPAMEKVDWIALRGRMMGEVEHNAFFKELAIRYIRENPGAFARLALVKLGRFWNPLMNDREHQGLFYGTVSLTAYAPVMLLALIGVAVILRRCWVARQTPEPAPPSRPMARVPTPHATLVLLLTPVVYLTLMHMVFVGSVRYRVPVMPFVILLAAAGWVCVRPETEASDGPRKRRWRWVRWVIWSLVVLAIAATVAYRRYLTPERLRMTAQAQLARLTGATVTVADAQFALGNGIVFSGITLHDPQSSTPEPMVRVGRLVLDVNWARLLEGRLSVAALGIYDARVRVELDEQMRWRFLDRLPQPDVAGGMPTIRVYDSTVEVLSTGGLAPVVLSRLQATVTPFDRSGRDVDISIQSSECGYGRLDLFLHTRRETGQVEASLSLKNIILDGRVCRLLPTKYADQWTRLKAEGQMEVAAKGNWDPQRTPAWTCAATGQLYGASLRPPELPWPITDLSAWLTFDGTTLRASAVRAKAGEAALIGAGSLSRQEAGWRHSFEVSAMGVPTGQALRAKLPNDIAILYDRLHPNGRFNVRLTDQSGDDGTSELKARVDFEDMAFAPDMAPVPLSAVNGRIEVDAETLIIRELTGRVGEAPFEVAPGGFVFLEPEGRMNLSATVRRFKVSGAADRWVPQAVRGYLSPKLLHWLGGATIGGEIDLKCRVERILPGDDVHLDGEVTARKMSFVHADLGWPLTDIEGHARYSDGTIATDPITLRWGATRLEVPANRIALDMESARNVVLRVFNLQLNDRFRALLPEEARLRLDEYGLGGAADLDVRFTREAGKNQPYRIHTFARLKDASVVFAGFPYPVTDVNGEMEFIGPSLRNAAFTGKNLHVPQGEPPVEITFNLVDKPFTDAAGKTYEGKRIRLQSRHGRFDEATRKALPEGFKRLWADVKPEGLVDIDLTIHRYYIPQLDGSEKDRAWFCTDVRIPRVTFGTETPVTIRDARVFFDDATEDEEGRVDLRGRFEADEAEMERVRLENLRARFELFQRVLAVRDITADCYGGTLTGKLTIPEGSQDGSSLATSFVGSLDLRDADVARITEGTDIRTITGRLNASSDFTAGRGQNDELAAVGAMTIRDGHIGELPGLLSVLNLLQLREPGAPAFHSLELAYEIRGGALIAHEINLLGRVVSLYGHGRVVRDGKNKEPRIDFVFRPEIGPRLPPNLVRNVLDWIKERVIPVTVSGDYNDPVLRLNPLVRLTRLAQRTLVSAIPTEWRLPKKPAGARTPAVGKE